MEVTSLSSLAQGESIFTNFKKIIIFSFATEGFSAKTTQMILYEMLNSPRSYEEKKKNNVGRD